MRIILRDILIFSVTLILAIAYSWIIGWASDLGNYIKVRLGSINTPNHLDIVPEDTLRTFTSRMGELTNQAINMDLTNTRTFESINSRTNMTISAQTWTENNSDMMNRSSFDIKMDMISQSLGELYKKVEEMEETNATQQRLFRQIIQNNKETDKHMKEEEAKRMKKEKAIKIELQGMRRRIESSEKKSH